MTAGHPQARRNDLALRVHADEYPEAIERVARAVVVGDDAAARAAMARIARPAVGIPRRRSLPLRTRCKVFQQDHFTCRYCGARTVLTPVMELVSIRFPQEFPFISDAWRAGVTHPAFAARSPMVDHVVPGSRGGGWDEPANLVTACTPCNAVKADLTLDQLGWTLVDPDPEWDGLTGVYADLWAAVGRPRPDRHLKWFAALGLSPPAAGRS